MEIRIQRESEIWKGVVAGAIGGFVASWVMNQFQSAWSAVSERMKQKTEPPRLQKLPEKPPKEKPETEDATMKAAGKLFLVVSNRELSREQKKKAGPIMHYAFGTTMGALYGGLSQVFPGITAGRGGLFASALFLGADEIAVPAFGLSSGESAPASTHVYAWLSHLVYGFTLDAVRGRVEAVLEAPDVHDATPLRRAA